MDADIDVFPDTVIRDWQDWELLEYPYEDEIKQSMPFISYLMPNHGNQRHFPRGYNRIRYRMTPSTEATRTNHQYTLNNLSERAEDTSWFEVDRRIRKDPNRSKSTAAPAEEEDQHRRRHHGRPRPYHPPPRPQQRQHSSKMDVTLAFRHRNVFTTKKMFTFGLRNVAVNTCHVYQTKAYPLLVYLPKPHVYISNIDRTFACGNYRNFMPYLIPPNRVVKIEYPTFYVLLTAGKVLFAVDVVDVQVIPEIEVAHGILIQNQLQPLPPPKPKLPFPSFWVEGPSVMPLPVEWDRKTGKMKRRTTSPLPPPPKFAWPPSSTAPPSSMAPPSSTAPAPPPLESKPGPSWQLTDWEKSKREKKMPIIITLSDDEDEDKIFISRAEEKQPIEIISSPDLNTVLDSFESDLGEEEVHQILNFLQHAEPLLLHEPPQAEPLLLHEPPQAPPSLLQQAINAAGLLPDGSFTFEQQAMTEFQTINFQDLHLEE